MSKSDEENGIYMEEKFYYDIIQRLTWILKSFYDTYVYLHILNLCLDYKVNYQVYLKKNLFNYFTLFA